MNETKGWVFAAFFVAVVVAIGFSWLGSNSRFETLTKAAVVENAMKLDYCETVNVGAYGYHWEKCPVVK